MTGRSRLRRVVQLTDSSVARTSRSSTIVCNGRTAHAAQHRQRPDRAHGTSHAHRLPKSALKNSVQGLGEPRDRAFDVMQFVQAKQSNAEGLEIITLVALKRDTRRDLQARIGEFLA